LNNFEFIEKFLALISSLLILFNGVLIKKNKGSWLFPGALFSLFWFAFTFFPLIILFKIPIDIKSQLYILLAVILFSNSYRLIDYISFNKEEKKSNITNLEFLNKTFLMYTLTFFVLVSFISLWYHLKVHNFKLDYFLDNPIEFAEEYSKLRYSLRLNTKFFIFLSFLGVYVSAVIGGLIYFFFPENKNKYYGFICFLPALSVMFTQSAKGPFFLAVFLFLGAGFAYNLKEKNFILFKTKNISLALKWGLLIMVLLVASFFSRGFSNLNKYEEMFNRMKYLFASYFLGHLYAFSDWFNSFLGFESINKYETNVNFYGFYTFNAITRYFNSKKEPMRGVYTEYFTNEDSFTSLLYTIFRGLVMDFGLIGSLLVFLLFGFFTHIINSYYVNNKYIPFTLTVMIFIFPIFYMSFMGSFFYWTVNIASFAILFVVLLINYRYVKKEV